MDNAACSEGNRLWLGGCGWRGESFQFQLHAGTQSISTSNYSKSKSGLLKYVEGGCGLCVGVIASAGGGGGRDSRTDGGTGSIHLTDCASSAAQWDLTEAGAV